MRLSKMPRKLIFGAAFSMAVSAAQARDFTVHVSEQEMQVIANALQERPFREVVALLGKLNQQITEQVRPAPPAAPEGK